MTASLAAAAATTLAAAFSPDWTTLIALRALTGLALSGVPAVAMAYLAEEMDRSAIGLAMGLYIAGNTLGGMAGRLGSAAVADVGGWRAAFGIVGLVSLACACAFAFALPRERRLAAEDAAGSAPAGDSDAFQRSGPEILVRFGLPADGRPGHHL